MSSQIDNNHRASPLKKGPPQIVWPPVQPLAADSVQSLSVFVSVWARNYPVGGVGVTQLIFSTEFDVIH